MPDRRKSTIMRILHDYGVDDELLTSIADDVLDGLDLLDAEEISARSLRVGRINYVPVIRPLDPGLQVAFADEARQVMGQPNAGAIGEWLGESVVITLNHTSQPRQGVLTAVAGPPAGKYLILDRDETNPIWLRSVETIRPL